MNDRVPEDNAFDFLKGSGEMALLMRRLDWSATPIGSPAGWSQSLRTAVRLLLNTGHPMYIFWGPEHSCFYNDAYRQSIGPERHPASLGRPGREVWAEIWEAIGPQIEQVMTGGEATWHENQLLPITRHGRREDVYWTYSYGPIDDEHAPNGVGGVPVVCTETTEQVRAQQTLERRVAAAVADLDRVWRNASDIFVIIDGEGVFQRVNPAATALLGWSPSELVGRPVFDFIHPDDVASSLGALERARGEQLPTFENRYRTKHGEWRTIAWLASPEGSLIYAYGRDVTEATARQLELDAAQQALRQAQEMEAVGQLTGGLAHASTTCSRISGSLEVIQKNIPLGRMDQVDRFMKTALGSVKRAAALTHRLLAFSRRQTLDPAATNANRLIADMEDLIRRTVGPGVHVEVVGAGGLWTTLVDQNQLENALLNLCINARDAMPEGGRLTIETANKWLDDRAARERDLPPGQYVSVCVTDNGVGMTADIADKAFDPFFTTKPLGSGTGLGLSMTDGFARQSGGQVRIYSEVAKGTTVCIYLPRHDREVEAAQDRLAASPFDSTGSGETVLVVDDEPGVRMLVVTLLEEAGYRALEASDGSGGLRLLRSEAKVDLLITDVGLPGGMNGRQMADAARQLRPALKVLFITGYAENAVIGNGHLEPGMAVVTKPFAMDALAQKIRDMLSTPAE